jgi:hypothetical protein
MQTFTAAPRPLAMIGWDATLSRAAAQSGRPTVYCDIRRQSWRVEAERGKLAPEIAGLVSTAPELRPSEDDFADLTSGSIIRVVLVNHCLQHDQHRVDVAGRDQIREQP